MTKMTKEKFGIILPIALFAYFLILMDNSIIFTSSVEISKGLNLSDSSLSWVSNAYTLTFGGFLLLAGRLSDLFGRKRIFQVGLFIFGVSSLVIGISQNGSVMIAARAVQGIGSSIIAPTTLALMMDAYTGEMRARAISYYGATAGIGSSIGLVIGGGLTSFVSWRAGFFINVPLTILLMIFTAKFIKADVGQNEEIDYLGSILSVLGLASLIYSLTGDSYQLIFFIVGLILLVFFYFREKTANSPIMPLSLFANKIRFGAYLVRLLFMMAMLPYWFLVPQTLQKVYNYSALESGFAFLPLTIVTFITALQLPKLTNKFSNTRVLFAGEVILLVGLIWTALSDLSSGYMFAIALPMLLVGLGQGLVVAPVTSAGIHKAPEELSGAASGLTNTMHQIGGPIGLSIIVALNKNFNGNLMIMAAFTVISVVVVASLILKKENS